VDGETGMSRSAITPEEQLSAFSFQLVAQIAASND